MGIKVEFWEQPLGDIRESMIEDFKGWYEAFGQDEPEFIDYYLYEALESNSPPKEILASMDLKLFDVSMMYSAFSLSYICRGCFLGIVI